jgi:hypothetical protein
MMTFSNLSDLTPAQSFLILDPERHGGSMMLKLTLMNLLLKGVFRTRVSQIFGGDMCIVRGRAFSTAKLKSHEDVFRDVFRPYQKSSIGVEIRGFARELGKEVFGSEGYRKRYVRHELVEDGYFREEKKRSWIFFSYPEYVLSDKGLEAQARIRRLLDEGRQHLGTWLREDPARAKSYLLACGANILLLDLDPKLLMSWIEALTEWEVEEDVSGYKNEWLPDYAFGMDIGEFDLDFDLDFDIDFDADFDADYDNDFDIDYD